MPFRNRAIIQGITTMFFRGPRSFAARNPRLFTTMVNGAKVRMVPPTMIALVAAAVSLSQHILFLLITLCRLSLSLLIGRLVCIFHLVLWSQPLTLSFLIISTWYMIWKLKMLGDSIPCWMRCGHMLGRCSISLPYCLTHFFFIAMVRSILPMMLMLPRQGSF